MKCRAFVGALVIILAAGCDPATGVVRTVAFTNTLSNEKIEAALHDVAGEKGFEHRTEGYFDGWFIRKGGVDLEIEDQKKGEKTLRLQSLSIGSSSTLAEQAETRKAMDDIYVSLRNHAPELPEPGAVHEKLIRVRK